MSYKLAIVGATGNVGSEILNILKERDFPVSDMIALASRDSHGKDISFGEEDIIKVQAIENFNFEGIDIVFFSAGSDVSKTYIPQALTAGCTVIDNSSYFRMKEDVPLIVPEINSSILQASKKPKLIANPNCSTIQLVIVLSALHKISPIERVVISTYQSVSGVGRAAMDELYEQTKGVYTFNKLPAYNFPRQIAFNVIPQIDDFSDNGNSFEEEKLINETKKILDPDIEVSATCVRVPVFVGHSLSVNIEFAQEMTPDQAIKILSKTAGVKVDKNFSDYKTPIDVVKEDMVYVSRVRADKSLRYGLNMWIVADNLRKGAALNAVQIAEHLVKDI